MQPRSVLAAHQMLGRIAMAMRDRATAREHLERALALARLCELPYEQATVMTDLAELGADEPASGSRELTEEARTILTRLAARPALEHLESVAGRAGVPTRTASPYGLTSRELEVLQFVAQGLTDAETAEALYISPRTVSQHLHSVYGKLSVSSRTAASRIAIDQGLI